MYKLQDYVTSGTELALSRDHCVHDHPTAQLDLWRKCIASRIGQDKWG